MKKVMVLLLVLAVHGGAEEKAEEFAREYLTEILTQVQRFIDGPAHGVPLILFGSLSDFEAFIKARDPTSEIRAAGNFVLFAIANVYAARKLALAAGTSYLMMYNDYMPRNSYLTVFSTREVQAAVDCWRSTLLYYREALNAYNHTTDWWSGAVTRAAIKAPMLFYALQPPFPYP